MVTGLPGNPGPSAQNQHIALKVKPREQDHAQIQPLQTEAMLV